VKAVIAIQDDVDRLSKLLDAKADVFVLMIDINHIEKWKHLLIVPNPRRDLIIMTHDPEVTMNMDFLNDVDDVVLLDE